MTEQLPAQPGGAKALLLTVLGEFVLPRGGSVWTASLVAAAAALGIGEKNARQAIARVGDQDLIESARHGRTVRWSLTPAGSELLETGTQRIYAFGTQAVEWDGVWLLAHCPVGEEQRAIRNSLRTQLGYLGFGELSPSILVSPHTDREPALRQVLADLGVLADSVILHSRAPVVTDNAGVVAKAWELDELGAAYSAFAAPRPQVTDDADAFRSIVELVHKWRRFPFTDPELPTELLPSPWIGTEAAGVFHDRHDQWSAAAQRWYSSLEAE